MSDIYSTFRSGTNFLFVPGVRPDRFAKALASGADGVLIDLEDSVAEEEKGIARDLTRIAWRNFTKEQRQRLVVRMNAPSSKHFVQDMVLAKELSISCVMIPKSESADQINGVAQALGDVAIIPLIESALGIDNIAEVAGASSVLRLALGNIDLQADLGMVCDAQDSELLPARFKMVVASRLAQLATPIDGITQSTDDVVQIADNAQRAKRIGFGGKLCIHPKQVEIVRNAFMPTEEEIDWAKRVIQADDDSHGGAIKLDGRMIDRPVVLLARRTLAIVSRYTP
ncbi:CoA ester lyase [Polynucleobacter sp. 31A-FELB]|uniref:HpcH/HpaI aldolase/citrate lyase family protein n=1 Tax=Polynucleobacter sp. 31A-FELB TaxID=2689096 RepID=UPI001C0BA954|nr:CoA ester lyase [Polynucleobacter sp. 31A-FELB]MBU3588299.1 CoA ester lyase [Polynucleobacter sp. 31A-FELB]